MLLASAQTSVQVYPNPFTNSFTLSCPNLSYQNYQITLRDYLGREVYSSKAFGPKTEIVLNNEIPAGAYVLQITSDNETIRYSVVKQK